MRNRLIQEMSKIERDKPGIGIMNSTNHFFALNKNEQDRLRESTHIQINDKELLAARQYIALVALTGGQQEVTNEGYQNGRFQSYIYQQQGIFPEGIEDTINNLGQNLNLQQKINEIARSITADNINAFYKRLIEKRPLVFYDTIDSTVLRPGVEAKDFPNRTGKSPGDYNLAEYINYSEMMFSGLLQVSGDTHFINDGRRYNCGVVYNSTKYDTGKAHQKQGSITAMVGARFEIYDGPDAIHFIPEVFEKLCRQAGFDRQSDDQELRGDLGRITQVTPEFANGFKGIGNQLFRNDYYIDAQPSLNYNNVQHGLNVTNGSLNLDIAALQRRLDMTYTKYLKHCVNNKDLTENKKAYIRIAGIGDGVWGGDYSREIQKAIGKAVANAYSSLDEDEQAKISVIELSKDDKAYFDGFQKVYNGKYSDSNRVRTMKLKEGATLISKQFCFAEELTDEYQNCILFVNFAWDSGSYVGNEYFLGSLAASSDPAAASCSTIVPTITPDLNPGLTQTIQLLKGRQFKVLDQTDVQVQAAPAQEAQAPAPVPVDSAQEAQAKAPAKVSAQTPVVQTPVVQPPVVQPPVPKAQHSQGSFSVEYIDKGKNIYCPKIKILKSDNFNNNTKFDLRFKPKSTPTSGNSDRNKEIDGLVQNCLTKAKKATEDNFNEFNDKKIGVCILLAIKHNGVSNKSSRAGFIKDLKEIYGENVDPKPFFKFSTEFQKAAAVEDILTGNQDTNAKTNVGLRLKRLSPDYGLEYLKGMDIKNGKMGEVFNKDFFNNISSDRPRNDVEYPVATESRVKQGSVTSVG